MSKVWLWVWSVIVSGALASILAWMVIERQWPWFLQPTKDLCVGVWGWATADVLVARWWYWALLVFFLATVAVILLRIGARLREPEWVRYTEDRFFGMVWRWGWGWDGAPTTPGCYCPECDRSMVYDVNYHHGNRINKTVFMCRHCQRPIERPGDKDDTLNAVRSEIDLKVRNGTWRSVVAAQAYQPTRPTQI